MCEMCLHTPCLKGCPNAPQEQPIMQCPNCKADLFVDNTYYPEFDACEFCIDDYAQKVEDTRCDYDEDRYHYYRDKELEERFK